MSRYCGSCGATMSDNDQFCPTCGKPVAHGQFDASGWSSAPQSGWNGQPQNPVGPMQPALPMKWFKFIIWVQLFLSALSLLGTGFMMVTGMSYGDYATWVYAYYGGLKIVDVMFGLLYIALAAAAVYVRFQLSGFKRNGPKFYLNLLLINVVVSVVYLILASLILGTLAMESTTVGGICGSIIMIAINTVYFKKRAHLFVN